MVRRTRSAKSLGTRHDLNYFKHWGLFRRWRVGLSVAIPLAGLVWLGATTVRKDEAVYSSGPLSAAHSVFTNQCSLCHTSIVKGVKQAGFRNHPTDETCLTCHEAPAHKSNESFTPSCSTCHMEHKGIPQLARVSDQSCTQCHSDLKVKSGRTRFIAEIEGFNSKHPEFAALRTPAGDPGTIALNHAAHMGDAILGPGGKTKLECSDCHRTSVEEATTAWKYGEPQLRLASASAAARTGELLNPHAGRELMVPIKFEKQCVACHSLQFDKRFSDAVPHKSADEVHDFVVRKFRDYIAQNPQALREPVPMRRQVPGSDKQMQIARNTNEWVELRVWEAEYLLWRKTCKQCHQLDFSRNNADGVPVVKAAAITERWMPHSVFSHQPHRSLDCTACHVQATGSQKTSDVLLPGIASCQSCHNGTPKQVGSSENSCFLCHQYHDWRQRKGTPGKYTIPQLTGALLPAGKPAE